MNSRGLKWSAAVLALSLAWMLTACGGDDTPSTDGSGVTGSAVPGSGDLDKDAAKPRPMPKPDKPAAGGSAAAGAGGGQTLQPSTCPNAGTDPSAGSNCTVASGRVLYVEAVDPDGDGDAHFVTTSAQSVTLPGITIFDVNKELRPDPLPGVGDLVGGAGPVYPGHAGQKQIQVTEFHVAQ